MPGGERLTFRDVLLRIERGERVVEELRDLGNDKLGSTSGLR